MMGSFFSLPTVWAVTNPVLPNIGSGAGTSILGNIVSATISLLLVLGGIASFIFFVTGVYWWITAEGDKVKFQRARERVLHALIGALILFAIFAFLNLFDLIFGVDLRNIYVPRITGTSCECNESCVVIPEENNCGPYLRAVCLPGCDCECMMPTSTPAPPTPTSTPACLDVGQYCASDSECCNGNCCDTGPCVGQCYGDCADCSG